MTKPRLTDHQKTLINRIQDGSALCRFWEGGEPVYMLEGHGQQDPRTVKSLIDRGVLHERGDAMFGVGYSFEVKLPAEYEVRQ